MFWWEGSTGSLLHKFRQLTGGPKDGDDLRDTIPQAVDNSVRARDDFADCRITSFRNTSTGLRKDVKSFDGRNNPSRFEFGIGGRILSNERADGFDVPNSLRRPAD